MKERKKKDMQKAQELRSSCRKKSHTSRFLLIWNESRLDCRDQIYYKSIKKTNTICLIINQ